MAKVEGPLFSLEARGKVGDAMVFFPWKGRHVVRQWLKPTNPQSTIQGYVRAALKAIAKWVAKVSNTSSGGATDSVIYKAATATVPAGLNWNAYLNQGFLDLLQSAGTYATASLLAIIADFSSTVGTAARTAFSTQATALGLEDFAFDYGYSTNIPAGLILYFGAKAAYAKGIVGTAPYTIDPVSWAASDVDNFATDHTATA